MPKYRPELYQSIFRLDYYPQLSFFDRLNLAAQQLKSYPHWQREALKAILKDHDKRCSLNIQHDSVFYIQDSNDIEMEKEKISELIYILLPSLGIDKFVRMGYRVINLVPLKFSFNDIVAILNTKLYLKNPDISNIIPLQLDDLLFRINFSDEKYKFNLTIGPIRKEEVTKWIVVNQHHLSIHNPQEDYLKIKSGYPEIALYIDYDIYQNKKDIPISDVELFIKESKKLSNKFINDICNYLFK